MLLLRDGVDCIISGYRLRCREMIWLSRAADQGSRDDDVAKPANQPRAIAIAIITDSVVDRL
jgi:hypothetical protein